MFFRGRDLGRLHYLQATRTPTMNKFLSGTTLVLKVSRKENIGWENEENLTNSLNFYYENDT